MPNNYTTEDLAVLDGISAIRKRPGMFIGGSNSRGMHHLFQEVLSNSVDEFLNGHGNEIDIDLDTKTNTIQVRDYGRGIPFGKMKDGTEALVTIATKLNSGGKFNDKGEGGYNVSGGLHGIGLTAANAMSDNLTIISHRENKFGKAVFAKGRLVSEEKGNEKAPNGTLIKFTPDAELFSNIKWDAKDIIDKVQLQSFLVSNLKLNLTIDGILTVYHSKEGIKDLLKTRVKDTTTEIYFNRIEDKDNNIVEIAYTYVSNPAPFRFLAFTNNIPNITGGTQVTGFKSASTISLNKLARKFDLIKKDDSNLNGELLQRGLVAVISLTTAEEVEFEGQVKDKLISPFARGVVSQATCSAIENSISRKDLSTIIEKTLLERKAEDAAKRQREAAANIKRGGKKMSRMEMPYKLKDCRNREKGELYLVEGDSAGGTAKQACDSEYQAILPLRGKVLNTMEKEIDEAFLNNEIKDIMNTLGCGVGQHFKLSNLRYEKIVLLADADPDGAHINVLLMTLFLRFFPEVVKAGRLYRALPPLFKVNRGKKAKYLTTNEQLTADLKKNGKATSVQRYKGLGENSVEQLQETVFDADNRVLVPLTTDDLEKTLELFQSLMGSNSRLKYDFIVANSNILGDK